MNKKLVVLDEASSSSISNMAEGRDKELPSFWIPSKTPTAQKSKSEKPVSHRNFIFKSM